MKKLLTLTSLLLCIVILLSLSACTSGGSAQATSEQAAAADTAQTASDTGKTSPADASAADTSSAGKRVYFAGPLFNHAEKDFNLKVAQLLEECGYEVFLPQRDGIEAALLEGKSEEELTRMIFELDEGEVKKADIIFMNLDGRVPDEGACVELGIAYASGKRCYGFKTDTRAIELNMDINPMISGCMRKIFMNYDGDALIEEIRQYLADNPL